MKDLAVWNFIRAKIIKEGKVFLTVVVSAEGSSPGKAGFKMAIAKNRKFEGTIGGGVMEYNLIESCTNEFRRRTKIRSLQKLYHNKKVRRLQSGLICAGSQTNFTCSLGKSDLKTAGKIINCYKNSTTGTIILSPAGLAFSSDAMKNSNLHFEYRSDDDWRYEEKVGVREKIYIVGGGHVGLAVSRQMKLLDFHVVLFDDREKVKTVLQNKYADKIIICPYDEIGRHIEEGENSFVAVVTAAYPTDLLALKQLIGKDFAYIGLMGSASKLKKIFSELKNEGVDGSVLKKINAPIGVPIESQTVEEIAVSVAAQIIKVKNSARRVSD